tara:strand:- start:533 stop:880 length:348 start_codon:yes stop_codon:yes gene_type:complete
MSNIIKAIKKINPNAEFKYDDEDINSIEWLNGTTPISKADIEAQFPAAELEIAMADLRSNRNRALKDSDWSVLPDVTLTPAEKSAWMNYRTLLRNITDGLTTVDEVQSTTLPIAP